MYARNQHANPTINETMGRDAAWRSSCCCYWPPSTKLASTIVISSYQMMGWLVGWLVSQHGFPGSPNSRVHSQAAVEDSWMFHDFLGTSVEDCLSRGRNVLGGWCQEYLQDGPLKTRRHRCLDFTCIATALPWISKRAHQFAHWRWRWARLASLLEVKHSFLGTVGLVICSTQPSLFPGDVHRYRFREIQCRYYMYISIYLQMHM